ncbi:hypothetical protein C8A01DRAFT_31915 [Parachaetomium inaequale]|uniref:Uncharacterized protein n=1 Tax=Parachaetomium inaequale TaxID=2588326 RepID=A0AAN6PN00_9PEZI|nr:hypothetical protein C8A01DRAFT_31915 [Parachaetomium inaequale]
MFLANNAAQGNTEDAENPSYQSGSIQQEQTTFCGEEVLLFDVSDSKLLANGGDGLQGKPEVPLGALSKFGLQGVDCLDSQHQSTHSRSTSQQADFRYSTNVLPTTPNQPAFPAANPGVPPGATPANAVSMDWRRGYSFLYGNEYSPSASSASSVRVLGYMSHPQSPYGSLFPSSTAPQNAPLPGLKVNPYSRPVDGTESSPAVPTASSANVFGYAPQQDTRTPYGSGFVTPTAPQNPPQPGFEAFP